METDFAVLSWTIETKLYTTALYVRPVKEWLKLDNYHSFIHIKLHFRLQYITSVFPQKDTIITFFPTKQ